MRLPRYRVWAGLTVWLGATLLDLAFWHNGGGSLIGFLLALTWSWKAPQ